MVMGKRAQFFLLAAVIISAVVISLGITANRASVNREPGNFYDFSYEVKREAGTVLDYEIYTEIDGNLDEFVNLLAADIGDKNPDADFMFLYGNNDSMELRNYGSKEISVDGIAVGGSGASATSLICFGDSCQDVNQDVIVFDPGQGSLSLDAVGDIVTVRIGKNDFDFPVSRHRQVIFIIQKEVGDESFIAVN